jgi:hypothetical protein
MIVVVTLRRDDVSTLPITFDLWQRDRRVPLAVLSASASID